MRSPILEFPSWAWLPMGSCQNRQHRFLAFSKTRDSDVVGGYSGSCMYCLSKENHLSNIKCNLENISRMKNIQYVGISHARARRNINHAYFWKEKATHRHPNGWRWAMEQFWRKSQIWRGATNENISTSSEPPTNGQVSKDNTYTSLENTKLIDINIGRICAISDD